MVLYYGGVLADHHTNAPLVTNADIAYADAANATIAMPEFANAEFASAGKIARATILTKGTFSCSPI